MAVKYLPIAVMLCAVGCAEERVSPSECAHKCVAEKVTALSSIDHEQPSAEALQVIVDFCERHSSPCCFKPGSNLVVCREAPTDDD